MRFCFLFFIAILISFPSFSQQTKIVSGSISDSTGNPLTSVSVNLKSATENLSVKTNASGKYQFTNVASTAFIITVTSIGYREYVQPYTVNKDAKAFIIDPIRIKVKTNELAEIVITASPITLKEDTIEYRADAYKVREGAPVEDVIKKLPGVTVDKDGNVTAQGKQIKRVRVNGKDYFGGDVQTATQNLPADIIDNIQIIDDYGDKANLTGIKEGEPEKMMNINIQKGKNRGSFGNATVAAGNESRYLGRLAANNFKDDRQISVLGSINNTNGNTFNFNAGGKGGGARGANFGSAERAGSGGDGNTVAKAFGFNYRDSWGKKINTYGSYSFTGRTNNTIGTSYQQDIPVNTRTTSSATNNYSNTANHRVTWNVEYKIDSLNYLKVTPYYSYASSNGNNNGNSFLTVYPTAINDTSFYTKHINASQSNATTPAGGSDLFFNHRFSKRGRNFSVTSSINYSSRLQDRNQQNLYHDSTSKTMFATDSLQNQFTETSTANTTTNVRASYSEPISKGTFIEASYTWNNSSTKSLRDVNDINSLTGDKIKNIPQSNNYKYHFITNRFGLSFHQARSKYNFLLGIVAQPSNLTGIDIGRNVTTHITDFNIAPNARFAYNFSRSHTLSLTYGGSSREPNFTQLQPVADSSNKRNIVIGNPNLNAEFTNRLSLQYNKIGILTGTSFFSNFSFDQTQNKIVSSVVYAPTGTGRTTSYINTNGFYGLNGNVSFTKPFSKRKFSPTVSLSGNYDNNLSFRNNQKINGQNWVISPGARFRIDITDIVDVDLNGTYSINKTLSKYAADSTSSTEVRTLNLGIDGKNSFLKNWTFGYDLTKIIYTGFISTNNVNPTLLNLYLERRFLKKNAGTLRIQAFDLFDQNTGIARTVNGATVTDVQNQRLGRYFMLSFNLRLQKFVGKAPKRDLELKRERQQIKGRERGDGGGFRNGGGGNHGAGRNN